MKPLINILKEVKPRRLFVISLVSSMLIALLVYLTGGTTRVFANLMYIPIIVSASSLGVQAGALQALVSGFLIGPYMPLNVEQGIFQSLENWIIRLLIYLTVASVIGYNSEMREKQRKRIEYITTIDDISGFFTIEALKMHKQKYQKAVLVAFKVMDYETIFDYFGFAFSNKMIKNIAISLNEHFEQEDNIEIFRVQGLEFLIAAHCLDKTFDVVEYELINKLYMINRRNITVMSIPIYIKLVVGCTHILDKMPLEAFRHALIAQNYAEKSGLNYYLYEAEIETSYEETISIASSFEEALGAGRITLHHQGIFDSQSDQVKSIELLARWQDTQGRLISPSVFIPILEKTELIDSLLYFVIDQCITLLKTKRVDTAIAINWSSQNLLQKNVDYIIKQVSEAGVNPDNIHIELTESSMLHEGKRQLLSQLKGHGFEIAIDDFGTGFSAYHYLGFIPVDIIKLDQSLVKNLMTNPKVQSLCKSIVGFCKENDIKVVAEGIEDQEVSLLCKSIGIDYLQGYYFHRPQPLA